MEAQQCISCSEYPSVYVPSSSDPDDLHEVVLNPDYPEDSTCDCESFKFRGTCKHQALALELLCLWSDANENDQLQTPEQEDAMECPDCGASTEWIEIDE